MQIILFTSVLLVFIATSIITLFALIGKFQVRDKFLGILVTGLLIEVGAAVVFLFRGLDVDGVSTDQVIAKLPEQVRAESVEQTAVNIRGFIDQSSRAGELENSMAKLEEEKQGLQTKISDLEDQVQQFAGVQQQFVVRAVSIYNEARTFGQTVNLVVPADPKKRVIARQVLELLAELDIYRDVISDDPAQARDALSEYQRSKGFGETASEGRFGLKTVNAMIVDYLAADI